MADTPEPGASAPDRPAPDAQRRALLARRLRARTAAAAAAGARETAGAAEATGGTGPAPASAAQRRLYFLERYRAGTPLYLAPAAFDLHGPLDTAALGRALDELVRRHEVLRTVFAERDGDLWQLVRDPFPLAPEVTDLTALDEAERAARLHRAAAAETQPAMDLAEGPLVRAQLLRTGPEDHRLVLTLHHIVADGWTLSLLVRELAALYEAFRAGRPAELPAPTLQYAEHARRERRRAATPEAAEDLRWWTDRLRGLPALELPTDRPRPAVQGWEGARHTFTVPAELASRVREVADRTGSTLFMVLLAAHQAVLHRWTGQDDLAVGSAVAGRATPELEGMAGLVANTLVLRTDLSGNPTFARLLDRVTTTVLDAYERQETPFEALVERLEQGRDPSRHPLFQSTFTLQNMPAFRRTRLGAATMTFRDMTGETAKCDLALSVLEADGTLRAELEYSTALFDPGTAVRFAGHYLTLLRAAAEDPTRTVAELPLLTDEERRQALADSRGPGVEVPAEPVHVLVTRHARATPGAPALVDGARTVTYGELDRRADRLARRLRELGAGPETPVGVGLERSAEQVVACLAVLKAGAAFVPLDPQYPAERLTAIREDAGLRLLITDRTLRTRFPMGRTTLLYAEDFAADEDGPDAAPDPARALPEAHPRSLAYVLHTSGSTGRPKGVATEHRSLSHFAAWIAGAYGLGPGERSAMLVSPGFDAALCEIWPALTAGAAVHAAPDEVRTDPALLARWIADQGITYTVLPTPLGEALLDAGLPDHARLRVIVVGGDTLTRRPAPGAPYRLVNGYGPSETTVGATFGDVEPQGADAAPGAPRPSIGRPIGNLRVHVLDPWLRPVPVGVPGELHVGGAQVTRGYLGDPRRTAARYLPDPFAGTPGARMYATGDLVRRLPDGRLEFLRRADNQVKIRGFRIEPGEVEAALRTHPSIAEAVVTVHEDAGRQRSLVAHLLPEQGPPPTPAELRRHLKDLLPHYMVPAHLAVLDALPLTPHGKVDRRALAAAPLPAAGPGTAATPPRGATEELVAGLWREVLGVAQLGADDNFFDLGGHSFLVLGLQARLRESVGREIPVVSVFQYPTVRTFAAHLDSAYLDRTPPPAGAQDWGDRRRQALARARTQRGRRPR
ncbi:non-ribosomal peptide synthetase [Streptomyces sp. S186]|uniref:non-ribosomal peptide synthetase n=1 Tax=Streptomyces sp. S186 TaxID=3434395 RepID=UPI003F663F18